jgi:alpha-maltose-1-phosphate synthase
VQVDVPDYIRALGTLATQDDARRTLGAQAMAHAQARFDWKAVVPLYLELARVLAERRAAGTVATKAPLDRDAMSPLEVDPFTLYRDYPTATLDPDAALTPGMGYQPGMLPLLDRLSGRELYRRQPIDHRLAEAILQRLTGEHTCRTLAEALGQPVPAVMAAVLYLAKVDLVRLPSITPRG